MPANYAAIYLAVALLPTPAPHPSGERWYVLSNTAGAITGNIAIFPDRVTMSGRVFRSRAPIEVKTFKGDFDGLSVAEARAVVPARNPLMLNGNHLCDAAVRWIVTWKTKDGDLGVSPSTSVRLPTSAGSPGSCGTFYYVNRP